MREYRTKRKIQKAVNTLKYIHQRASKIGCTVALYNHEDWFGEPANEVKIIKASGLKNVGIVYNFHHGHKQMDDFDNILKGYKTLFDNSESQWYERRRV